VEKIETEDTQDELAALIAYDIPKPPFTNWEAKVAVLPPIALRGFAWRIADSIENGYEWGEVEKEFFKLCRDCKECKVPKQQVEDAYENHGDYATNVFYIATCSDDIAADISALMINAALLIIDIHGYDVGDIDDRVKILTVFMKYLKEELIKYRGDKAHFDSPFDTPDQ